MAEVTPPLFVDSDNAYGADELGLPFRDIVGEGVVETGDLLVSQRAAGANMSVDVAAGAAWVQGDTDADRQPTYRVYNDATVNLAVTAADPALDRLDLVIAEVLDSAFTGSSKTWRLRIVEGTPAATPAEPALPDTSVKLAVLDIAAAQPNVGSSSITDTRPRATVGGGLAGGSRVDTSSAVPGSDVALGSTWTDVVSLTFTLDRDAQVRLRYHAAVESTGATGGLIGAHLADADDLVVGNSYSRGWSESGGGTPLYGEGLQNLAAGTYTYTLKAMRQLGTHSARAQATMDGVTMNLTELVAEIVYG